MDDDVYAVLRDYPKVYMACHVEHRTRGSGSGLTSRDAGLLAHVEAGGVGPAALARHLGISPSTLSEALGRLAAQGLLTLEPDPGDARRRTVRLTPAGQRAVAGSSVLDAERVERMLGALTPEERRRAVEGLGLLAIGARRVSEGG